MATVLHAPDRLTAAQRKVTATLFLAGPFDAEGDWRDDVIDAFAEVAVTIIDPRNERWAGFEPWSPGRRGAFEWQCASAYDADVVVVWVPDGASAPTARMVLGFLAAKRGNATKGSSVVVGGDELVRLFAQNSRLFPIDGDLTEVIRIARIRVDQAIAAKGNGAA
jgi:hypothetical protein